jgi:hypothetical protein
MGCNTKKTGKIIIAHQREKVFLYMFDGRRAHENAQRYSDALMIRYDDWLKLK